MKDWDDIYVPGVRYGLVMDDEARLLNFKHGSPAERAGCTIGSKIVAVDNHYVNGDAAVTARLAYIDKRRPSKRCVQSIEKQHLPIAACGGTVLV